MIEANFVMDLSYAQQYTIAQNNELDEIRQDAIQHTTTIH
jgi:hypothetical protein